ncbi:hypothetical protein [Enemella sp. A6]|uniref:hypothetical protein n=1 Tax=Enemella sp. A6 TaxID=3440152 RepID=UPI003EB9E704
MTGRPEVQHPELQPTNLADPDWIAERIGDTARRWSSDDPRVNATLWWYSASSTICQPLLHAAVDEHPVVPRPDPGQAWLRDTGYLGGLGVAGTMSVEQIPGVLRDVCAPVITALSRAGGASERSLWAVLGDSICTRSMDRAYLTDAGNTHDQPDMTLAERGSAVAARIIDRLIAIGVPIPRARFDDIAADGSRVPASGAISPDRRRFTRRSSCCLIHKTTDTPDQPQAMCSSCPRLGRLRGQRMAQSLFS